MERLEGAGPDPLLHNRNPQIIQAIQHQLVLLLHASKCLREDRVCSLPYCSMMKGVLIHQRSYCEDTTNCPELHCISSRQIIRHWKICYGANFNTNCPICLPLKRSNDLRISQQIPPKDWHSTMTQEQRQHLVELLCRSHIRAEATAAEVYIYKTANTLEDYYRMIAAKNLEYEMSTEESQASA